MNQCLYCSKETSNPKYCSRSCAAKYNNSFYIKRELTNKCRNCGKLVTSRKKYCSESCRPKVKILGTIEDAMYKHTHKSSAFAHIRSNARRVAKNHKFCECSKCGYDKHYEVCHIKSISSFPLNTPISEVNNISNLIALCPNCHWEHDNGLF